MRNNNLYVALRSAQLQCSGAVIGFQRSSSDVFAMQLLMQSLSACRAWRKLGGSSSSSNDSGAAPALSFGELVRISSHMNHKAQPLFS
jgi:hypothetical protein